MRFYIKQGFKPNYIPLVGEFGLFEHFANKYGACFYELKQRINNDPKYIGSTMCISNRPAIFLSEPKAIRELAQSQADNVIKDLHSTWTFKLMHPRSYNFKEGETHKKFRKIMSGMFQFDFLKQNVPTVIEITKEVFEDFDKKGSKDINILLEVGSITGEVIGRSFFGAVHKNATFRGKRLTDAIPGIFDKCGEINLTLTYQLFGSKLVEMNILPLHRETNKLIQDFSDHCLKMVQKRKVELQQDKGKANPKYLLDTLLLMQADGTLENFSDLDILDQYLLFFTAGQDTTAHLILMTMYLLAKHPEHAEKIRQEIKEKISNVDNIDYDQLTKMDFLTAVIKETQRLYNPAQMILPRMAIRDFQIGDIKVKKGTLVDIYGFYATCNNLHFKNADVFDPYRWMPGGEATKINDPFLFIPFWAGVRNCIGQHLAFLEARVILIQFCAKYHFTQKDAAKYQLKMNNKFQYDPIDPIIMNFEKIRQ